MRARDFLAGMATTVVTGALVGLLTVWSGAIDVSGATTGGRVDAFLRYAAKRSIARHAPHESNPFANDASVLPSGLAHFKANCGACHAGSSVDLRAEFAHGLNPSPPSLTSAEVRALSDGEIFWVVSNGIRGTGMPGFAPTHSADEIWKIVSFVRHLPELSEKERKSLQEGHCDDKAHHHESGH
jgi:mono/diheme cytochrome c family protein